MQVDTKELKMGRIPHADDARGYSESPSTVSQLNISGSGDVPGTGSTVELDKHSTASSADHSREQVANDTSRGAESGVTTVSHNSTVGSETGGPAVSEMTPTTHNAYGGGLYGTDLRDSSQSSSNMGRASDFQSAEGLAEDLPAHHVKHEPPSTGDRDLDITGQSYIQ